MARQGGTRQCHRVLASVRGRRSRLCAMRSGRRIGFCKVLMLVFRFRKMLETYLSRGFSARRTDFAMRRCCTVVVSITLVYHTVGKISPLALSAFLRKMGWKSNSTSSSRWSCCLINRFHSSSLPSPHRHFMTWTVCMTALFCFEASVQ